MSFIDQSSLVITASVCLSCCGGTIEAPFKMHRVNTVHAAHAINSLVASWCSMYCTPFVARCAQKPDAQRAKVNLTTWQSTWKSGQPWCSWDTVHVSLLWKGIYWNIQIAKVKWYVCPSAFMDNQRKQSGMCVSSDLFFTSQQCDQFTPGQE